MSRVKVKCDVKVYEVDDVEHEDVEISVRSHWLNGERVELEVGGHRYMILGSDLMTAVKNAQNTQ